MKSNAWPFLVSRNQSLDYRVVVAPGFISDDWIANKLVRYVDANAPPTPTHQEVRDPEIGNITIVYRVTPAIDGELEYKDHVGRQILWIEGVILKSPRETVLQADAVMTKAHAHVIEAYNLFWKSAGHTVLRKSKPLMVELKKKPTIFTRIFLSQLSLSWWQYSLFLFLVIYFALIFSIIYFWLKSH